MRYVGKINIELLQPYFGNLQTNEVILTDERKTHIKERHIDDYPLFEKYKQETIENPDVIIRDVKNDNTVFFIKNIEETNMNIVIKLSVVGDNKHSMNSVLTAYRIRERNVKKLEKNNIAIYKRK